jgi:hypothetical protein
MSILWIIRLYVFNYFTCVEMICEMKGDDYKNKRMIVRSTCYCILLINENKRQ